MTPASRRAKTRQPSSNTRFSPVAQPHSQPRTGQERLEIAYRRVEKGVMSRAGCLDSMQVSISTTAQRLGSDRTPTEPLRTQPHRTPLTAPPPHPSDRSRTIEQGTGTMIELPHDSHGPLPITQCHEPQLMETACRPGSTLAAFCSPHHARSSQVACCPGASGQHAGRSVAVRRRGCWGCCIASPVEPRALRGCHPDASCAGGAH